MKCPGLHCDGCRDGGGGLAALLLVVLAVIIAAAARPVAHAADAVGHAVLEALEITGIVLVSAAGLAILAGMAYGAHRAYRWHAVNRQAIPRQGHMAQRLSGPQSAAIGAPRKVIPLTIVTEEEQCSPSPRSSS